jgi:hypothetical protein
MAAAVAVTLAGAPTAAHHSFAAHYFEDQTVVVEGEVVEFQYRSPHALLIVEALDAGGELRRYTAEWSNPNRLARAGVTVESLRAGEHVIVTGSPGRVAADDPIHLKQLERPADGWRWPAGRRRR